LPRLAPALTRFRCPVSFRPQGVPANYRLNARLKTGIGMIALSGKSPARESRDQTQTWTIFGARSQAGNGLRHQLDPPHQFAISSHSSRQPKTCRSRTIPTGLHAPNRMLELGRPTFESSETEKGRYHCAHRLIPATRSGSVGRPGGCASYKTVRRFFQAATTSSAERPIVIA
jgi:hypothetical protein